MIRMPTLPYALNIGIVFLLLLDNLLIKSSIHSMDVPKKMVIFVAALFESVIDYKM